MACLKHIQNKFAFINQFRRSASLFSPAVDYKIPADHSREVSRMAFFSKCQVHLQPSLLSGGRVQAHNK